METRPVASESRTLDISDAPRDKNCAIPVAVIGMAGRFPGAKNVDAFWKNLCAGIESIERFEAERQNDEYIPARGCLGDVELFDASFFGVTPRDAETMDPQHRLFLECCWSALENAGLTEMSDRRIGVFAAAGRNSYAIKNLLRDGSFEHIEYYSWLIGNERDFLSTRVSHLLDLRGPSFSISSACSSSLVAIDLACQSVREGRCAAALAGGVELQVPERQGYRYQRGGILSPDGHCRAFDARAEGTVFGNGVGVVVLKRLEDAILDGDFIHAVIMGSAVNNDGSSKVGYAAPSVRGQSEVIVEAHGVAGVAPRSISYIEAHGTGTSLGDPLEIRALESAFRVGTSDIGFCAIGSVKTNVGHLDAASGITGLIKTVLALRHRFLPASLHFVEPNPEIDFSNSPFYVNTSLRPWECEGPRRAGVSSFGIGGTNAHVVLEEAPLIEQNDDFSDNDRAPYLITLSAKSPAALEASERNLATFLEGDEDAEISDTAYTLQVGREAFDFRRCYACQSREDVISKLSAGEAFSEISSVDKERQLIFMFPGQGSQQSGMGIDLYRSEPVFREQLDACAEYLSSSLGMDIREVLYSASNDCESREVLSQTSLAQPILFSVEYSLSQLWMYWGIEPQAMIGHSVGEYVAACLSGVLTLKDALSLLAARGHLMQQLPEGKMLAVMLSEESLRPRLEKVSLAAVNGPDLCVVSGSSAEIEMLVAQLSAEGVMTVPLQTSHAFHSEMMDPILDVYMDLFDTVTLNNPQIPYISNVTGTWITEADATDPSYWIRHVRETVLFDEGIGMLLRDPQSLFIEVGPGQTLTDLAKRHPERTQQVMLSTSPPRGSSYSGVMHKSLGQCWVAGASVNWKKYHANKKRRRIPLPTYPFQRQRHWVDPEKEVTDKRIAPKETTQGQPDSELFYVPSWKRCAVQRGSAVVLSGTWLVFVDECGFGDPLAASLEDHGVRVIYVRSGESFSRVAQDSYQINPKLREHFDQLLSEINVLPDRVVHLWTLTDRAYASSGIEAFDRMQDIGFFSLLFLTQAVGERSLTQELRIEILTNGLYDLSGDESLYPEKATLLGPCKVIPQEYPNIWCRSIDIDWQLVEGESEKSIDRLISELKTESDETEIAYRGRHRWIRTYDQLKLKANHETTPSLKQFGVYLITGGLGGIGLSLAAYLADTFQAKLILIGRSSIPDRLEWNKWLTQHPDDPKSRKIESILEIERLGGTVLALNADVADPVAMSNAIATASQQFGEINGIIHSAGVVDGKVGFSVIQNTTPHDCNHHFAAKVYGTLNLFEITSGLELDFAVAISSISTAIGGEGLIGYVAANHYTELQCARQFGKPTWQSLAFDRWRFNVDKCDSWEFGKTEGVLHALEALHRPDYPCIIISKRPVGLLAIGKTRRAEDSNFSGAEVANTTGQNSTEESISDVETAIVEVWKELLGVAYVDPETSFFDIGADSLSIIEATYRLQRLLKAELGPTDLFEFPTVRDLAGYLSGKHMEGEGGLDGVGERAATIRAALSKRKSTFGDE